MSASQDRLNAKKRRTTTQEDEKYTTPKTTAKLQLPTLTKTPATAQKTATKLQTPTLTKTTTTTPKTTAKLQMPTLTKTATTAAATPKTTKYTPANTGIKINALGAGDYGASKTPDKGYSYGKGIAKAGLTSLGNITQMVSTPLSQLERLTGKGIELVTGQEQGKGLFERWDDSIKAEQQAVAEKYRENTEAGGEYGEKLEGLAQSVFEALPSLGVALATGGGSAATKAADLAARTAGKTGLVATAKQGAKTLLKDPNFITSAMQIYSGSYNNAKSDGASELQATAYALANAGLGGYVEIQGGLQKLPKVLQGDETFLKALAKTMLEEGTEEVEQGVIDRTLQRIGYGADNPLLGFGENGIIDPAAALEEFAGGAIVGGLLGGSTMAVGNALNKAYRKMEQAQVGTATAGRINNENGLAAYTPQEKISLSGGAKNRIVTTYQEALEFVKNALSNKNNVDRAYMGIVPDSTARRVANETGVNISGYGVMMNGNDIRHITKEHGNEAAEALQGQGAATPEAIAQIPKVISAPDNIRLSDTNDGKGRKALVFEKKIGDTYITVQGVSDGKHVLQTDTLYIQKEKARKMQDTMLSANEDTAPVINVRDELPQGSFEGIVPQLRQNVKAPQIMRKTPKLQMPTLSSAGLAQNEYSRRLSAAEPQKAAMLDELGRRLGMRVELVDSVLGGQANGQYLSGRNTMQIAADAVNPVEYVAAHEATHHMKEQAPAEYEVYKNATADYYRALYGEDGLSYMIEGYKQAAQEAGVQLDDSGAMDEIAADFTEKLMNDADLFARFAVDNRTAAQKLLDALKAFIAKVKTTLTGGARDTAAQSAYGTDFATLERIAAQWQTAFDAAAQNAKTAAQTDGGVRYMIKQAENGMKYVQADRQVIFGNDPTAWSEQLQNYIDGKIRRGEDVQFIAEDGDVLTLTATSAGKLSSQYDNNGRTMSEDAFERKVNAATHIDELAQVSRRRGRTKPDEGDRHGEMAKNGWHYREALFRDFDGTYYRAKISVAQGVDGNSIYNIGQMKKEVFPKIKGSYAVSDNGPRGNTSQESAMSGNAETSTAVPTIRSKGENVKEKFSLKSYSDAEKQLHAEEAKKYFGKTYKWSEAGYITTDGSRLDFSGKHEGAPGGYRTVDHRDITDALGGDYGGDEHSGGMVQFMAEGNIRISPESGGIDLSVMPTKAQMTALSQFVEHNRGEVILDIDTLGGDTISSTEYPKGTRASKVIEDIRRYFETGETPYVSDVSRFRYQLKSARDVEQELNDKRLQMPQLSRQTGFAWEAPQIREATEQDARQVLGVQSDRNQKPYWRKPNENVPVTREQARQRMAEETAARAAEEAQRRAVPETMQRLGVAPFGSEADYAGAEALAKNAGDNERARRRMKKEIEKLPATEKERMFARQVYNGQITMEDIPNTVNRETVAKLTDYYATMDSTAETELLRQKRNIILEREAEKMETLLGPDVEYDEGGLRESGKRSGKIARQFSTLRRNLQTPARICATEWGAEHGGKVYKTLFWPVTENNGRQVEWVNSMIDRVRTFKDSTGKERPLNRAERAIVQRLVETSAAEGRVTKLPKQYAPAAENVKNGASAADAAREFGIQKGTAEYEDLLNYAANLAARADAEAQENVDAAAVDAAVEAYGKLYSELYEAINTFLAARGYKPIGFIEGYAPHMQPEETKTAFSKAMKLLGLDDTAMMLPTSISGQTADLKPYKQYDPFFQTRQGNKTEYDIAQGFENYIYYLGNIFYHTDDIMRIRSAANYMRKTYSSDEAGEMIGWAEGARSFSNEKIEGFLRDYGIIGKGTKLSGEDARVKLDEYINKLYEQIGDVSRYSEMVKYLDNYANRLAGKQNMVDRGAEAATGRGSLNWINALTGKFGGAKLAFNVSSALNQTGQLPVVMAENGEINTAKAIRDFFGGKEDRNAFIKSSNYLKGKKGVNWLVQDETAWEKVKNTGFAMTEAVDGFTAYVAVRSKYLKELNAGKSKSEAMRAADEYGRNVMGSRARGEKPMLFDTKNPFWQIVTRFQLEAMNSWEHISRDVPKEIRSIAKTQGKTKAAQALAARAGRYVVYAFLANWGVGALSGGSPVPFDVVGNLLDAYGAAAGLTKTAALKTILDNVLQQVFDERLFGTDEPDDDDEADLWAAFESLFGNAANDVPIVGRVAALAGIGDQTLPVADLSKLGDFASTVKDKGLFSADALDKGLTAGSEFLFGGNQLRKTVQGSLAVARGGVYGSNGRLRYEVGQTPWNAAQGFLFGKSALKESQEYYAGSDSTSRFSAEGTRLKEAKEAGDETAEVVSRWWNKQQSKITELYKEIGDTGTEGAEKRTMEEEAVAIRENALDMEATYKAVAEKYLQRGMDVDEAYREANRECFGAEYALETYNKNVYDRAQDARRNGVSYEDFYDYYFGTKDIEATDGMSIAEWKLEYLRNSGMDETTQAALWLTDMASDSDVVEQMELEADAGITLEQYYAYKLASSGSTKKAEKLDAINAMDLSVTQKNAIYYAEGWAESKLREAPWYTGRRASESEAPTLGTTQRPAPVLGERYDYYSDEDSRPAPVIGQQYGYYSDGARPAPVIGEKYSPYFTETVEQSSRPAPVIGETYQW